MVSQTRVFAARTVFVFEAYFVLHFTYFELVTVGSSTGANVVDAVPKPCRTRTSFSVALKSRSA